MPVGLPDRRRAMRQTPGNRRRRLPARLRSPDAPHLPGRSGPRPVPRVRVGRAAAPVRAPVYAAERRALLPDERAHRPRGELRRRSARRRRDAAAERRRPVPDDRDAARLRRQQGELRERCDDEGATTYHWNANYFARRGYAVVNPSARGFGRSCGQPTSRTPDCARGWIHLADQRYEARDTQHLLGLLADQGVARPGALGVTGISYGGGQSLELAFLRDRIRKPDGSFAPWRSPKGTPLSIAAAYPRWLWSDLVNALLPNGRFVDFRVSSATESREPIGVPIQSFISGLYATGACVRLLRAVGPRPRRRPHVLVRAHPGRRALRRRHARDRGRDPRASPGLRAAGHAGAAAAARRLDRRPVPLLGAAADLQRAARRQPERARVAAVRRPRPPARVEQGQRRPGAQRRGLHVPRRLPARSRLAARAGQRHRVHPDLPARRGRRRPVHGGKLARAAPRRGDVRRRRGADGHLRRRRPADRAGVRPDLRRRRRLQEHRERERAGHRRLHRLQRRPLHADGPPDGDGRHPDDGRQWPARLAAVGRRLPAARRC